MVTLQLSYSVNGGTTFSTAISVKALKCRVVLRPSFEDADKRGGSNAATICQNVTARYEVLMELSSESFDKAKDATNYETKWQTLQKWACAPIKRIYCPTANYLGWTIFDSASNTNYVILDSEPEYEWPDLDDGTQTVRRASFRLKTSAAVVIT